MIGAQRWLAFRSSSELQPEGRAPTPCYLFPEDRRFPIRMTDELPLRWVKSGPGKEFHGEAQRNEFYVFQIGVWAARTNLAGLDVEFNGEIAGWLNCFNTGGTNWDGKPFHKTINVPQGKVQALWIGVDVPRDAKPGEHRATVTIRPTNAAPAERRAHAQRAAERTGGPRRQRPVAARAAAVAGFDAGSDDDCRQTATQPGNRSPTRTVRSASTTMPSRFAGMRDSACQYPRRRAGVASRPMRLAAVRGQ